MTNVETLGDAWSLGWRVHMRCAWGKGDGMHSVRECVYSVELDLETLVCTRGRAFPLCDLAQRMRCPRCGSRKVTVMFTPTDNSTRADRRQVGAR